VAQRQAQGCGPQWLKCDGRVTGWVDEILRFLQRRACESSEALKNQTPDVVHKTAIGGGAMILDKYGAVEELPIALRSTRTAQDEV